MTLTWIHSLCWPVLLQTPLQNDKLWQISPVAWKISRLFSNVLMIISEFMLSLICWVVSIISKLWIRCLWVTDGLSFPYYMIQSYIIFEELVGPSWTGIILCQTEGWERQPCSMGLLARHCRWAEKDTWKAIIFISMFHITWFKAIFLKWLSSEWVPTQDWRTTLLLHML